MATPDRRSRPRPDSTSPDEQWGAVVVGGGVAGLVAARELVRAGVPTLVLEGRDAAGGSVRGHEVAGLRLDAGAESFATRGGAVAALLEELGLGDALRVPQTVGSWAHLPGKDGPLPRTGVLGIPARPWAADVRATLGLGGALRASLDLVLPASVGKDAASLGALVTARMGRRVVERLVQPIVGGVHAADPDDLAVDAVAPGLQAARAAARGSLARAVQAMRAAAPAGAAVQGVDGGMFRMVDALVADVEAHGGQVRTRSRVRALAPQPDGSTRVLLDDATVQTPRLVLATPAAGELLQAARVADLSAARPDDGARVTLVTLVVDCPALDAAPRGTGVLVAPGATDVQAKALTHATAKWAWLRRDVPADRHVVRLSYGRAGADNRQGAGGRKDGEQSPLTVPVREGDDAVLVEQAVRDASVLLGVPLTAEQVVGTAVVRWTQALPRPSATHREAVAAVRAAVADLPGVAVCGAWADGNGLASVVPAARAAARSLQD
ncbi:protoporphyrinogen/coproporphyrinogen oxidase [Cellulomonas soli]|uniref:Protoporphyrinogen oxidase n=1 Tax=Cellulomonas soli TaxID=931535 RepID=A0A512PI19_9CELL|nr:FAD-dependent oxidoreductase [Cellulomonas soli]NYI58772.1 oxygen-dependent protoporphyrinogen oxidase [Cellulomonas soli]GEP70848.1 protoporphyrinogen oxidase [Cellulomonas soli]